MTILHAIDAWLAKTIFWPIIIKICHIVGCTKWAFGKACSFTWIAATIATQDRWDVFSIVILTLIAVMETISFGAFKDAPYGQSGVLRAFWIGFFVIDLIDIANGGHWERAKTILMIFYCYAATLPSVPPRRRREETDEKLASLAEAIR